MLRKDRRSYFVFVLLIVFTALVSSLYIYRIHLSSQQINTTNYLRDNWTCQVSSGTYYSLAPPSNLSNHANNTMVLTHMLPDVLNKNDVLYFRSSQQAVKVFLDDIIIYEYQDPGSRITGIATPSHWNFIPLETSDAGKELRIELRSPYALFSGKMNAIYLGDNFSLTSDLLAHVLNGYICTLVLLVFGILIILSSFIFINQNEGIKSFRYLGLYTILLALWMRSEVRVPDYLMFNPHVETLIGFLSLFLCPIPYLLFIKQRLPEKLHKVIHFLLALFSANFVVCIILQLLGIHDLVESSIIFPIFIIPTVILVCMQYLLQIKNRQRSYPLFSIFAFVSLVSSIAIELLYYYFGHSEYLGYLFRIDMIIYVACLAFSAVDTIVSHEMVSAQASELILKHQIKMMLSHIQPHFLFNSLGAIQSLIKKSPDTAYKMLFDFSKYLRSSINAWNNQSLIPFSTELENVKSFTNIQLIRFRNSFRVEFDIAVSDFSVPLLSIRALVENAVNHGARKSTSESPFVHIHSYETPGLYVIEIVDNGPGFDVDETLSNSDSSSGIQRCQHLFQSQMNASLNIHSTLGKGTTVIVHIPR